MKRCQENHGVDVSTNQVLITQKFDTDLLDTEALNRETSRIEDNHKVSIEIEKWRRRDVRRLLIYKNRTQDKTKEQGNKKNKENRQKN